MKAALIALGLLAAAGGVVALLGPWAGAPATQGLGPESLYRVAHQDLEITLSEQGTLVAKEARKVVMLVQRGGKIVSLVEEGKLVTEGEVLVSFDTTELQTQIEQLKLEIVQDETNLRSAQTELEIQRVENLSAIEKAASQLERAEQNLQRYREADAPQERRRLLILVKDAQTNFGRAKKRYEDSKRLLEKNYIKRAELETDEIAYEKALVEKEGAELSLSVFERYTLPMTLQEKEASLREARRDQETANKRTSSQLLQKEVAVTSGQKRLQHKTSSLEEAEKDLKNMVLSSPCPGIVIYGDPKGHSWYRQQIKVGGELWGGNTVMTIPDLRQMQVRIAIHEADINKVALGQKALVTMDTYPGLVLSGSVTKIAAIAGSGEEREAEVKKFDVEVTLEGEPGVELKPGISAKAVIQIDSVKQALAVPIQCVFLVGSEHFCFVSTPTGPAQRAVRVGQNNASMIEVTSGLALGEEVLLYNPKLAGSGAKGDLEARNQADAAGAE